MIRIHKLSIDFLFFWYYNFTIKFKDLMDSGIAQSVEQLTVNQLVVGSSPSPGAKK